jgi:hypothetical protein
MSSIEPSVNDQLRHARLVKELDTLDRDSLLAVSKELARLALLMQPAAMRWAATEAAKNLVGTYGSSYDA